MVVTLNDTRWQLADHQGTIRDVEDASGTLRKHVEYGAFGNVQREAFRDSGGNLVPDTHVEAVDQLFYFAGRERGEATGLQLHGARWYSAKMGRFVNEDPIGFDSGDPNLYRYASNNPVTNTDPTGLKTLRPYDTLPALTGFGQGNINPLATNRSLGNVSLSPKPAPPIYTAPLFNASAGANRSTISLIDRAINRQLADVRSNTALKMTLQSFRDETARAASTRSTANGGSLSWGIRVDDRGVLRRTWDSIMSSLRNREPLIADPLASRQVQIGNRSYVITDMHTNAGLTQEVLGNLYHRSPAGGNIESVGQFLYNPIRAVRDNISSTYTALTNVHRLPEQWQTLPDYKKQDFVVNAAAGTVLGTAPLAGRTLAIAPSNYPPGTFSIAKQKLQTYPSGAPRPQGPFRILEGAEYREARKSAYNANRTIRDPYGLTGSGLDIHEIQPIKFGGSPTNYSNKVLLDQQYHREVVTPWWNQLQREVERRK